MLKLTELDFGVMVTTAESFLILVVGSDPPTNRPTCQRWVTKRFAYLL